MSWAAGRRAIILAILGGVLLIIVGVFAYLALHKAPSCVDGKMNNDEEGIDCGGSLCTYLCAAGLVPPSVSFVRELPNGSGRTDVIAYVKNPNATAAMRGVRYTVELYDANRTTVAKKDGTIDLPPGTETPVYLPNVFAGNSVERAFLSLDESSYHWFRFDAVPAIPTVANPQVAGTALAPRVVATITNPFQITLRNIRFTATVFDGEGNAIAASQTVIPELAPQAHTDAVFTWNVPFSAAVSRIDVKPVIPLPSI